MISRYHDIYGVVYYECSECGYNPPMNYHKCTVSRKWEYLIIGKKCPHCKIVVEEDK